MAHCKFDVSFNSPELVCTLQLGSLLNCSTSSTFSSLASLGCLQSVDIRLTDAPDSTWNTIILCLMVKATQMRSLVQSTAWTGRPCSCTPVTKCGFLSSKVVSDSSDWRWTVCTLLVFFDRHILAKWFLLPHFEHRSPHAGHFSFFLA